jgi:hypothetical protein
MMNYNFFPDFRGGDDSFIGIICGMKQSGKTTLLIDLLKSVWKHKFNLIVIVSPTFSLQDISLEITDGRGIVVFSEFRNCIIKELIDLQEDKIYEKKEIQSQNATGTNIFTPKPKAPEDHHVLLVFDDIGSLGKDGKLAIQMANLAYVVRHFKISIIELAQRVTLLSTGLSSQANFWIFFVNKIPMKESTYKEESDLETKINFGKFLIEKHLN